MANERKSNGKLLIDSVADDLGGKRTQKLLNRLDQIIPWQDMVDIVLSLYKNNTAKGGRPNVPVLIMLKCVML